jgi:ankyrin repeat protein
VIKYNDNTYDDKILKDIQELINAGANVNYQSSNETTAIVEAAGYGTPELVKLLLAAGANVNLSDGKKNTALTKALEHNENPNIEIVKLLINAGADINVEDGEPLFWAIEYNNSELINMLISAGADVNKASALITAVVYNRDPELVKLLLAAGANVNLKDREKNTALTKALEYNENPNIEIIKILINAGADLNVNNGEPLFWAIEFNNIELVIILISAGADVNIGIEDGFSGDLPQKSSQLMFASVLGRIEIVRLLLIEGADVNHKNEDGKKAIDYAIPQSIISDLLKNPSASLMMGKKNRGVVYIPDNNKTNSIAFDDITNGETVVRIQQFGKDFFYRLESWKEFMNNELKNYPRRLIKNPINRAIVTADQIDIFTANVVAADLNSSVVGSKRPRPANLRGGTRRRRSTRRAYKKRVTRQAKRNSRR